jgi:glycosyltransferase involved in cell wall biosynthesis
MRVWLLHIGEELPIDGRHRLFRYGHLAHSLQVRGHQVLRWAPTFRHSTKTQRFPHDRRIEVTPNYAVRLVHSPGYRRTTSLARLWTYRVLGRRFPQLALQEAPPDVIVAAIPSLEWAVAAVEFGRTHCVPVIVDVRDLWPDVFPSSLPRGTQSIGRWLLAPYRQMAQRACRGAAGLSAVSEIYLSWALRHAGRERGPHDCVLPHGYEPSTFASGDIERNLELIARRGIDSRRPICLFAGGFERHHEVDVIVDAARRLAAAGHGDVQFVLCGDGSKMPAIRRLCESTTNVHLMGLVDAMMLQALASISVIGVCAYAPRALISIGNKPFEYMAGRLALVSSLPGELAELLQRHQCGINYRAGDAESLANCLIQLLKNPDRLTAMRENAYRAWSQNFRSHELYSRFVAQLEGMSRSVKRAA